MTADPADIAQDIVVFVARTLGDRAAPDPDAGLDRVSRPLPCLRGVRNRRPARTRRSVPRARRRGLPRRRSRRATATRSRMTTSSSDVGVGGRRCSRARCPGRFELPRTRLAMVPGGPPGRSVEWRRQRDARLPAAEDSTATRLLRGYVGAKERLLDLAPTRRRRIAPIDLNATVSGRHRADRRRAGRGWSWCCCCSSCG
jgi:hypothetical protein